MASKQYRDEESGRLIFEGLPPVCYVHLPGNEPGNDVGIVKRGEDGYYPARGMTPEAADRKNATMKVSHAQREAMHTGSMFGWHVPGADPAACGFARPICEPATP